jgi:predicted transcriptional regulator
MISGSMGLPAVGVNRLGIVRDRDSDEALFCSFAKRGREVRWQVRYDPQTCQWIKVGEAKDHQISIQRQAILDALEEAGRPMRLTDMVKASDMKYNNCLQLVKRMVQQGLVVKRESDGLYDIPDRKEQLLLSSAPKKVEEGYAPPEAEKIPTPTPSLPLPPECRIEKCDHRGNRSLYGIYWKVLGPDGESTEPEQYYDSAVKTAWARWAGERGVGR